MKSAFAKLATAAALGLAAALTFNCSSADSPNSPAPDGSSSSSLPPGEVLCVIGASCAPIPLDACNAVGTQVNSCPVSNGSSSSAGNASGNSSSSGGLPPAETLCVIGASCISIPVETCISVGTSVSVCPVGSSSSKAGSSSSFSESGSNAPVAFDGNYFIDPRDGKRYKYETDQNTKLMWMAENLNYSRGGTLGWCYAANSTALGAAGADLPGCEGYGRAYTWEIAMDGNSPRGLCPYGWHIPSVAEWQALGAGTTNEAQGARRMPADFYIRPGNYNVNPDWPPVEWRDRGSHGFYWTSNSKNHYAFIYQTSLFNTRNDAYTTEYYSVRCVSDGAKSSSSSISSSSSSAPSSSSSLASSSSIYSSSSSLPGGSSPSGSCSSSLSSSSSFALASNSSSSAVAGASGTFTDSRDSKVYKWVKIGTQTWMAENLNYNASNSVCYNNQDSYCATYGRLYNWTTAMGISSTHNNSLYNPSSTTNYKGVCPTNWHLPNITEWNMLLNYAKNDNDCTAFCVAKYLKATKGWNNDTENQNSYGFAALPGGTGYDGNFANVGNAGYWWSASEFYIGLAYGLTMVSYDDNQASWNGRNMAELYSVRCVKD